MKFFIMLFLQKSGNSNKPLYLSQISNTNPINPKEESEIALYMTIQKQPIILTLTLSKSFIIGEHFLISSSDSSISKSCCYRVYQWPGIRKSLTTNRCNSRRPAQYCCCDEADFTAIY